MSLTRGALTCIASIHTYCSCTIHNHTHVLSTHKHKDILLSAYVLILYCIVLYTEARSHVFSNMHLCKSQRVHSHLLDRYSVVYFYLIGFCLSTDGNYFRRQILLDSAHFGENTKVLK